MLDRLLNFAANHPHIATIITLILIGLFVLLCIVTEGMILAVAILGALGVGVYCGLVEFFRTF